MLPSKGYFKSFNCPFYDNGSCERPHCHYRHIRKEKNDNQTFSRVQGEELSQDSKSLPSEKDADDKITATSFDKAVEKILFENYLNKSEGKNESKIEKNIITKVSDDLTSSSLGTYPSNSEVPSYKPTPISELNRRHIPVAYPPNLVKSVVPKSRSLGKKPKIEYVPQSENGKEPTLLVNYSPTPSNLITKDKSQEYFPTGLNWNHTYTPSKITGSNVENESASCSKHSSYSSSGISSPLYTLDGSVKHYNYACNNDLSSNNDVTHYNVYSYKSRSDCQTPAKDKSEADDDLDLDDISPELDMLGAIVDSEMQESDDDFVAEQKSKNMKAENISASKGNDGISTDKPIQIFNQVVNASKEVNSSVNTSSEFSFSNKPDVSESNKELSKENYFSNNLSETISESEVANKQNTKVKLDKVKNHSSKHKSKHKSSSHSAGGNKSSEKRSSSISSSSSKSHDKSPHKSSHSKDRHHSSSSISSSKEKTKSHSSSSSKSNHDSKNTRKVLSHSSNSKQKSSSNLGSSNKHSKHKKIIQNSDENNVGNNNNTENDKGSKPNKNENRSRKRKHSESHLNNKMHSSRRSSSKSNLKRKSVSDHRTSDVKKQKQEEVKLGGNSSSSSDVEEIIPETDIVVIDSDSDQSSWISKHDMDQSDCCDVNNEDNSNHSDNNVIDSEYDLSAEDFEIPFDLEKKAENRNVNDLLPEIKEKKRVAHSSALSSKTVSFGTKPFVNRTLTSPSKTLIERWQKSYSDTNILETEKLFEQENSSSAVSAPPGPKVRIAHVPNVNSLLNAKKNLLFKSSAVDRKLGSPASYSGKRNNSWASTLSSSVSAASSNFSHQSVTLPVLAVVESATIPVNKRQLYLGKIFEECLKIYNEEMAKRKAIQIEKSICESCKNVNIYMNKILLKLCALKKEMNLLTGETPKVPVKEISVTTADLTPYECLLQFLVHEDQLKENTIPVKIDALPGFACIDKEFLPLKAKKNLSCDMKSNKFKCINCNHPFTVDKNGFSVERKCRFHPVARVRLKAGKGGRTRVYDCCGRDDSGCIVNEYHVREMLNYDCMPGFVETLPAPKNWDSSNYGFYAIDCEMCFTTFGQELVRVTVINGTKEVKYDKLVITEHPIVDYCTKFSGITEDIMKSATKTLKEVQRDLMSFIFAESILIGHGIGNDLKVLKLIHKNVVDTTVVFPHIRGPPSKRKLSEITYEKLKRLIQNDENGHDSKEDALACLDLMLLKVAELKKSQQPRKIIEYTGKK